MEHSDGACKQEAPKRQRGRPAHVPTPKDRGIASLGAAIGIQQDHIARMIGIHDETLRTYYREELDIGKSRANLSVGQNLYRIATGNTPQAGPAAMFWMKTQAGWKETVRQENSGAEGGPIKSEQRIIFSGALAKLDENL
jgi:hypothetical protein